MHPKFQTHKSLKEYTTLGIGGAAKYFVEAATIKELSSFVAFCHENRLRYYILGKGSNSLFDDRGFDGLVILNKIHFCEYGDKTVYVGAGYSFSLLGVQTARKGWGGLEFASGIPASVGGAIYMNAGASGRETRDCLKSVTFVEETGKVIELKKEEISFSYRYSSFQDQKGAIAAATFALRDQPNARDNQIALIQYRTKTQPYHEKSAGCAFRNPEGNFAGKLIQDCQLKGLSVGDAKVSDMHANFIVNKGNATAQEVKELVRLIQEEVKKKTGIELEMEIQSVSYEL